MNEIVRDTEDYKITKREIYLDQAASSDPEPEVMVDVMTDINHNFYNPSSIYAPARTVALYMDIARIKVKKFINARDEDQIIFGSCASEMIALALGNSHVITSYIEHPTLRHRMINEQIIRVDEYGYIDLESLEQSLIWAKKKLGCRPIVAFADVNSEIGVIQDIESITELAHKYNALVCVDHSQGAAHYPIDVQIYDIDMLVMTSEKCGCIRGTGVLYVRKGLNIDPLWSGGNQESGLRPGTENTYCINAFVNQLERISSDFEERMAREYIINSFMIETILESCEGLCNVTFYPYFGRTKNKIDKIEEDSFFINHVPNIISAKFDGIDNQELLTLLDIAHVCCSAGSACSSYEKESSHVLKAIGLTDEEANNVLRFSFDYRLKDEEIIEFGRRLRKCLNIITDNWDYEGKD